MRWALALMTLLLPVACAGTDPLPSSTPRSAPIATSHPREELGAPPATLAAVGSLSCAITSDRGVSCWGGGELDLHGLVDPAIPPTRVQGLEDVVEIAMAPGEWTGQELLCARARAGAVRCVRMRARDGTVQLAPPRPAWGDGSAMADAASLALDAELACGLRADGEVRCGGVLPESLRADTDEQRAVWPPRALGGTPARALTVLRRTPCRLDLDGHVRCMREEADELELGEYPVRGARLAAGGAAVCAYAPRRAPACWAPRLAVRGLAARLPLPFEGAASSIALSRERACAVSDEALVCWGGPRGSFFLNEAGEAAHAEAERIEGAWREVALGDRHYCARRADGRVACAGDGSGGQLGSAPLLALDAPRAIEGLPAARRIAASASRACAITTQGELWCWGAGHARPARLEADAPIVDVALSESVSVTTGDGRGWTHANDSRVAAVGADGRVRVWTDEGAAALADVDDAERVAFFGGDVVARLASGSLAIWADPSGPPEARRLPRGARAFGGHFAIGCAIDHARRLACWIHDGDAYEGDLANAARIRGAQEIAAGGAVLCARVAGAIECFGSGDRQRVVAPAGALGIAVGDSNRVCAITEGRVACVEDGRLEPVAGTEGAEEVAVGYAFACARFGDGSVRCWGNNYGEALGVELDRETPTDVEL